MSRKYYVPKNHTKEDILRILDNGDSEELRFLGIAVGLNYSDWKFAQDICLRLADNDDALVRANAIFGLAHIARTKQKLDKRVVKPIVLRELRYNYVNQSTILDAIDDINLFRGWSLALKEYKKYR